jgi:hypothetical protein
LRAWGREDVGEQAKEISMPPSIQSLGLTWYSRENYDRILEIMVDADKLPRNYDVWLKGAENGERRLKSSGRNVVRAMIDPEEFIAWCAVRGLTCDSNARQRWGADFAYAQMKNTSKGSRP